MLDIFKAYATDEKGEVEGVEVDLGGGASIIVARIGNPNYVKVLLAESEKHEAMMGALPAEEAAALDAEILVKILAETILLGFKGLGYKGKKLPYSKENAVTILRHREFQKRVMAEAGKLDNFRVKYEEEAAKNS